MLSIFRKRIRHPLLTPEFQVAPGETILPGAAGVVLERTHSLPVTLMQGAGTLAGDFQVLQNPQVFQNQNVQQTGLFGVPAGELNLVGLTQNPYDNSPQ